MPRGHIRRHVAMLLWLIFAPATVAKGSSLPTPESEVVKRLRTLVSFPEPLYIYLIRGQPLLPDQEASLADLAATSKEYGGYFLIETFAPSSGPTNASPGTSCGKAVSAALKSRLSGSDVAFRYVDYGDRYADRFGPETWSFDCIVSVSRIDRRQAKAANMAIKASKAVMAGIEVYIGDEGRAAGPIVPAKDDQFDATLASIAADSGSPAPTGLRGAKGVVAAQQPEEREPFSVRLLYISAPTAPATYNKLIYRAPSADATSAGDYDAAPGGTPSALGVGLETLWSTSGGTVLAVGGRFRRYQPFEGKSTFLDSVDQNLSVKISAQAVGGWTDAYLLRHRFGAKWLAMAGAGLDFDYSIVKVEEAYQDNRSGVDDTHPATTVTSTLAVASMRLASRLDYAWSHVGVGAGVNFQLPLGTGGHTLKATSGGEEWIEILDHRSAIGSEVALGFAYRF